MKRLLAGALMLVMCGCGSNSQSTPPTSYAGEWEYYDANTQISASVLSVDSTKYNMTVHISTYDTQGLSGTYDGTYTGRIVAGRPDDGVSPTQKSGRLINAIVFFDAPPGGENNGGAMPTEDFTRLGCVISVDGDIRGYYLTRR